MNCELEFRNYARSRRAERPIPQIMAVRHSAADWACVVSSGKIRRLGRLSEVDFRTARPELRASRIMSDKRTLSDMWERRQARRIWREFER